MLPEANPGVEVWLCGNAILLNTPNSRTTMPRFSIIIIIIIVVVVVVLLLLLLLRFLLSHVFPGNFPLEPVANPTIQASSF
jgi:hypothetical protein